MLAKLRKIKPDLRESVIMGVLFLALTGLVVLMLLIAGYSCRVIDDYSFSVYDRVWASTHSLWKTMLAEISATVELWHNWQGTYFSLWFYLVLNSVFGKHSYYIGAYIAILSLVISELYAAKIVVSDILQGEKRRAFIVAAPVLLLQLMFPPSAAEGFYWMIAAILYTFAFASQVLLFALVAKVVFDTAGRKLTASKISIFLLLFMVAGSNYICGLSSICLYALILVYAFCRKNAHRLFLVISYIWFIGCFLLNALSPGARIRQDSAGAGLPAATAIFRSFVEAASYIRTWWILPLTLTMIGLIPILWHIAGSQRFRYRLPLLFTLLSFGVYASQFTPCLYALGMIGAYRVQNLYRFTLYLWAVANEWYWIGYLRRRLGDRLNAFLLPLQNLWFAVVILLATGYSMLFCYGDTVTARSAYQALRSGNAATYYQENVCRVEYMENCEESDVVLKPYSVTPYLLFINDLQPDPDSWENAVFAQYFGKTSVRIASEEVGSTSLP